jgi:hypothetical protein
MYWFRIIWNDRDWDWTFIYVILEHKLKSVADHEERFGHHTTSARDAHDIRIAAELCKRIRNSYWKDPPIGPWMTRFGKWPGDPDKAPYFYQEYMEYMIEQDSAMLHDLLHKKARRWWN